MTYPRLADWVMFTARRWRVHAWLPAPMSGCWQPTWCKQSSERPQDAALPAMAPTAAPWGTRALTGQAASDEHLVAMLLHGRSAHTQRAYGADAGRFRGNVDRSLREVTVGDVQPFLDTLLHLGAGVLSKLTTIDSPDPLPAPALLEE